MQFRQCRFLFILEIVFKRTCFSYLLLIRCVYVLCFEYIIIINAIIIITIRHSDVDTAYCPNSSIVQILLRQNRTPDFWLFISTPVNSHHCSPPIDTTWTVLMMAMMIINIVFIIIIIIIIVIINIITTNNYHLHHQIITSIKSMKTPNVQTQNVILCTSLSIFYWI